MFMRRALQYIIYWLISLTWGCLLSFVGLLVGLVLLITGHKPYKLGPNIYFKVGHGWGGVEFGPIFVVAKDAGNRTICHEAGHGIQNLIWGPLMPFVISIPSAIRYWYRETIRRKNIEKYNSLPDYDSIWFEGQATDWGIKYYWYKLVEYPNRKEQFYRMTAISMGMLSRDEYETFKGVNL